MAAQGKPLPANASFSRQFRRCGKPACPLCRSGAPGHGPYWYAYWREGGRVRSRYVGKHLPPNVEAPGSCVPETAPAQGEAPAAVQELPVKPVCLGLRVRTLGGFAVWRDDVAIAARDWHRHKAAALFKCLLSAPTQRLHRERVMDLLWPDADPVKGGQSLRLTVHRLRRVLGEADAGAGYVRVEGEVLVLVPAPSGQTAADWLDAVAFEQLATQACRSEDIALHERARSLYAGDYLPDDPYDEWAVARREELSQLYMSLLLHLAGLYEHAGAREKAIGCLKAVIACEPHREEVTQGLMRLLAAEGRYTEAVRAYRRMATALQHDLRLAPDRHSQAIYRALLDGRRAPSGAPPGESAPVQPALDALRVTPAIALLGRAPVLAELHACLQQAAGQSALVLLRGAAGVGKSRLLVELMREARARNALVLFGRAYRQEGQLPYGPVQEALQAYVQAQPAQLLAAQGGIHAVLVRLVPELAHRLSTLPPSAPLEPSAERHRLFAALAALMEDLGRRGPILLALEDLHWADPTTLQVVHYLRRACQAVPLLIAGTYRPEEIVGTAAPAAQRTPLDGLQPDLVLDLQPLSQLDGAALVAALLAPDPVDAAAARQIAARAEGNPLFVTEVVAALRQSGRLSLRQGHWRLLAPTETVPEASLPLPASIQALIVGQVERLGTPALQLLRRCAVLGKEIPYALLRQAGGIDEDRLLDAVEAALGAGVLEETAAGERPGYVFHHALIREAIYSAIPVARRALLHRQAGEALAEFWGALQAEHAADLAWHFGQGGAYAQAAHYALQAGDRAAAAFASPEALTHYIEARSHLARQGKEQPDAAMAEAVGAPARSAIDEKIGDMRFLLGDYAEAQEDFARARMGLAAPPDQIESQVERWVSLWCKEGDTWLRRGDYDRALATYAAAETTIARMPGAPPECLAALSLSRGEVYHQRWMFDALTGAMTRVLTLLGSAQEGAMHARAYFELAMAAYWQGENQRAQGYLGQSLGIWEHLGNQIGIISSLNGLGLAATDRDDYRRAEQFFGRTRDLSTRIGYQLGIAVARMNLTMVSGFRGEFGGIAAELDDVLALAERIGATGLAVGPLRILGYVAEHEARYTDAEAIYEQGLELQERLGIQAGVGYSIKGLANVALARGDLAQAEVLYRRALAVLEPTHLTIFIADCWIGLGKTLRQCGDLLTAAWLFRRARRTGRRIGCVRVEAMATVDAAALQLCAVDANLQMNPGGWAEPLDASGQKESASGCGRMAGMRRLRYARALLARGQRLANSCDALVPLLEALLMAAELHLRDGDLAAARAAADEAQQRATRAGMRRCEGQALYARGRCALAAGCSDEAEAAVRAALSLQEAIGAALDAERSRACLEELRASLE